MPLLISYGSIRRAKGVLNFATNILSVNQRDVQLKDTPRWHIYLPMMSGAGPMTGDIDSAKPHKQSKK